MAEDHRHRQRADVVARLARIEGHVRAVRQMSEEGRDCADILFQLAAIQSALRKVAEIVLDDHMQTCVLEVVQDDDRSREILSRLKHAVTNYLR